jgi:hypothetical protein
MMEREVFHTLELKVWKVWNLWKSALPHFPYNPL